MNNLITAFLISSVITAVLVSFVYLWNRSKVKPNQCEVHDLRSFDINEVVWFNGHKFEITNYEWCDKTMHIFLTLKPREFPSNYKEGKLDSRHVKKVVRVYAEFGDKEYNYFSTVRGYKED